MKTKIKVIIGVFALVALVVATVFVKTEGQKGAFMRSGRRAAPQIRVTPAKPAITACEDIGGAALCDARQDCIWPAIDGSWAKCVSKTNAPFDFELAIDLGGDNISIMQGGSVVVLVKTKYRMGKIEPVTLSAYGLPQGASVASITNNPCTPDCASNLMITTTKQTPAGTYTIYVSGLSQSNLSRNTQFNLVVNKAIPAGQIMMPLLLPALTCEEYGDDRLTCQQRQDCNWIAYGDVNGQCVTKVLIPPPAPPPPTVQPPAPAPSSAPPPPPPAFMLPRVWQ